MVDKDIEGIEIGDANGRLANTVRVTGEAASLLRQAATDPTEVSLKRPEVQRTDDQALWSAIRNRTEAIGFNRYAEFIDRLLCCPQDGKRDRGEAPCGEPSDCADAISDSTVSRTDIHAADIGSPSIRDRMFDLSIRPNIYGVDAYQLLKLATEAFLIFESGVVVKATRHPNSGLPNESLTESLRFLNEENIRLGRAGITFHELAATLANYLGSEGKLPYLQRIVTALLGQGVVTDSSGEGNPKRQERLPYCEAILRNRFSCPSLLELI